MLFEDVIHHSHVYLLRIEACKHSLRNNFITCTCSCNSAFMNVTGITEREVLHKKVTILHEIIHPFDYSNFIEALRYIYYNQTFVYKTIIRIKHINADIYKQMFLSTIIQTIPHTTKCEFICMLIPVTNEYADSDTTNRLTNKEKIVQACVEKGLQSKQIAETLHVSIETIKTHRRNIKRKLEGNNILKMSNLQFRKISQR